ncbi:uncharacterized protein LY89DRAFT_577248 [Mollisia scopiformis]|uniref:Fe2OG dioxygenase domain-containing protein n=1 Tax=Mollisia scopiformis TaxID=149040 RepID=A0A194XM82_MOLSC|nr:uncharacterized protein LY89DRAFT_577248 [Mollisia scopiformis]KUJ21355.1 hypothetical protein LY89DRAFT_577248 [Mollisia scopiformis]
MATITETVTNPYSLSTTKQYEPISIPPFDPAIHLDFTPPTKRYTFTSLNLPKPATAPDTCFTEPFQLFSDEGVRMIRRDLLRKEVLDKHLKAWDRAPGYIGGAEETTKWVTSTWHHPAVTACVSEVFGLPLNLLGRKGEVGYVNVQLGPEGREGVYKLGETPSPPLSSDSIEDNEGQNDASMIDSWHKDSTQVVVVVMLSDCSTMLGGETAVNASGTILKARGMKAGSAVVMQGAHTPHAALRSWNSAERISMVTSYGFVDVDRDDSGTSLRSTSPGHHEWDNVKGHFLEWKLGRLRERVSKMEEKVLEKRRNGGSGMEEMEKEQIEGWVKEQITFLKQMSWELCERYPKFLYKDVPEGAQRKYLSDI